MARPEFKQGDRRTNPVPRPRTSRSLLVGKSECDVRGLGTGLVRRLDENQKKKNSFDPNLDSVRRTIEGIYFVQGETNVLARFI